MVLLDSNNMGLVQLSQATQRKTTNILRTLEPVLTVN